MQQKSCKNIPLKHFVTNQNNIRLWNTTPPPLPRRQQSEKSILSYKMSLKVEVIGLAVIWKGIVSGVYMPNIYEVFISISYG